MRPDSRAARRRAMRSFPVPWIALAWAIFALWAGCDREREHPAKPGTSEHKRTAVEAHRLTEAAYDLKQTGRNARALALLVQAGQLYAEALGREAEEVASNLDDQATIHFRIGDSKKARALYLEARRLAERTGQEGARLRAGIDRRLRILEAFGKQGIACTEPMEPSGDRDAGALSYFPDPVAMQTWFEQIGPLLTGCIAGPPRQVAMRMVITGDGRIAEAEAREPLRHTADGRCLEQKLVEVGSRLSKGLPRFRACFRNFTYPFIVGG